MDEHTQSHTGDPRASRESVPTGVDRGTLRGAIVRIFEDRYPLYLTTPTVTDHYFRRQGEPGWRAVKPDSVAKRMSELHNEGVIYDTDTTAVGPEGRPVTQWGLVPEPLRGQYRRAGSDEEEPAPVEAIAYAYQRVAPDLFLRYCSRCSAYIRDTSQHTRWHDLRERSSQ